MTVMMRSYRLADRLNVLLLVSLLPLALTLLCFNYAIIVLSTQRRLWQRRALQRPTKTILILGVSGVQGLQTARALSHAGHKVIGVDLERTHFHIAKHSRAVWKYYYHPPPSAVQDSKYWSRYLAGIIRTEHVDLWIDLQQNLNLSTSVQIRQQLGELVDCVCVAPAQIWSRAITTKESFFDFLHRKDLPAPEFHRVKTRGEIHNILNRGRGKKHYALQPADDDQSLKSRRLLPQRTLSETYHEVSTVKISSENHLVLEEHLDTSITYSCNSIVVGGVIKDFWASRTKKDNALPEKVSFALAQAFRSYLQSVASAFGSEFTSHLNITFCLIERITVSGVVQQISPIRGRLQLDPTVLRADTKDSYRKLAQAYTAVFMTSQNGSPSATEGSQSSLTPQDVQLPQYQAYLFSELLHDLVVLPTLQTLRHPRTARITLSQYVRFAQNLLFNQDAYYQLFDPLPAFWQYFVVETSSKVFGIR